MQGLRNIKTLTLRELYSYFCSPIAYVFLILFLLLLGFFCWADRLGSFYTRGHAELSTSFFLWHPWLFMILVPAVGMRFWSEELNSGTLELLCTLPINLWQAVFAKYLAGIIFLAIAIGSCFPMVITVNYLGNPDNGKILCGFLSSFLTAAAFLSLSSATSALTRNQVISFIVSMVMCLLLILSGFQPVLSAIKDIVERVELISIVQNGPQFMRDLNWVVDLINELSLYSHFQSMQKGIIDSRDIIYYLSVIIFGNISTLIILKNR